MMGKVGKDQANRIDDRIPAAGKSEVGEAELFVIRQESSSKGRIVEQGKEIVLFPSRTPLECLLAVVFHFLTLGGAVPIAQNVNAPFDPCLRFRFGNPEQVGQGSGLQREGEFGNRFDRFAGNHSGDHFANQTSHSRLVFRFVRTIERRFHDLAVLGVLGRIGFDGELPDASQVLLPRNGNPKGGIGTEGLPVAGGLRASLSPRIMATGSPSNSVSKT